MSLNTPEVFTKTEMRVCHDKQNLHVVNERTKPNVNQTEFVSLMKTEVTRSMVSYTGWTLLMCAFLTGRGELLCNYKTIYSQLEVT